MDHVTGCENIETKQNPNIIVIFEDMELNRLSIYLPFTKEQCEGKTEIKTTEYYFLIYIYFTIIHFFNNISYIAKGKAK